MVYKNLGVEVQWSFCTVVFEQKEKATDLVVWDRLGCRTVNDVMYNMLICAIDLLIATI